MAKPYLVSYDLNTPGKDYSRLTNALVALGAIKILYSEWVLRADYNAEQIRNHLQQFVDSNDMLLVTGLTGEAAWTSLMVPNQTFIDVIAA